MVSSEGLLRMFESVHYGNWKDASKYWADNNLSVIQVVTIYEQLENPFISLRDLLFLCEMGTELKMEKKCK